MDVRMALALPALLAALEPVAAGETAPPGTPPAAREILDAMDQAAAGLRDYTMTLVRQEFLEDRLAPEETMVVKWARPHRTYVRYLEPHQGREVLFVRGWNRDRLRVHKGSFPDINLNIDPEGSMAMSGSHHPASQASIVFLVGLILEAVRKAEARGEGSVTLTGTETFDGRPCLRVELTSPSGGVKDTVRKGESLWDVARRHGVNMSSLLHHNRHRGWRKATHPRGGDEVFVPDYYASRVVLLIDPERHLPLKALVYDHEGQLYERYEHHDLRVNVGLTDRDFDPDNPDYHF